MKQFKYIRWIFIAIFAFLANPTLAVTDTVFVQKRITDTLYVVSPPDTVYIQESVVHQPQSQEQSTSKAAPKNEFILEYSTDTIPPATKFYINTMTGLSAFSVWFGAPMLELTWEIENTHRGSLMINFATVMLFGEYNIRDEDPTWKGFRSLISPGVGYRHYLFTYTTDKTNPKKQKVVHKNTPLNSNSFYIQSLASPTFKVAYDQRLKTETHKSGSFDAGLAASATLGSVWNMGNMLWDFGITFGYQYWGDKARRFLSWSRYEEDVNYRVFDGWTGKGLFFGTDFKLGF